MPLLLRILNVITSSAFAVGVGYVEDFQENSCAEPPILIPDGKCAVFPWTKINVTVVESPLDKLKLVKLTTKGSEMFVCKNVWVLEQL